MFVRAAFRACPALAMTRCCIVRSYVATYSSCTYICGYDVHTKGSLLHFVKDRRACKMTALQPNFFSCDCNLNSFKKFDESKRGSCIRSSSISGFACHLLPSTSSFRISSKTAELDFLVFDKRMFSSNKFPESDLSRNSTNVSVFVKDGKVGKKLLKPTVSNHHQKRVKAFATRGSIEGNSKITFPSQFVRKNPILSVRKNADIINSIQIISRDGQNEANFAQYHSAPSSADGKQESKAEVKQKPRSRTKKNNEEFSGTLSSPDVLPSRGNRKATTLNGLSPAEKRSIVDTTGEELVISGSPQTASKKKRSKSRKKGTSAKENEIEMTINAALRKPEKPEKVGRTCNPPQEPKLQTVNGIKSNKLKPLYPPTGKSVLVVESLTKAKVIQQYLGDMYEVVPSYGHVRDLAAKSRSVRPDDDFSMVWEVPSSAWPHLERMKLAISGADNLILALDPDREGEAISWHIIDMLQKQKAFREDITISRVVFHEITESSIKNALQTPRDIDVNLVHAYLAHRAFDYLIGFNISPLLWKNLPGCQSAGRLQSVALSLLCDRELEIEEFKPQKYWTVEATFSSNVASSPNKSSLRSYLTLFGSKKLNQFSIGSATEAKGIEQIVISSNFEVAAAKKTKVNIMPPTPFITSTLQQDAANKLKFSASYTMKLAQKLYEGIELTGGKVAGLITYMKTEGLHMSDDAVKEIRSLVQERYGFKFAAHSPQKFFKKVKNAQEAHEAIRPTDIRMFPSMLIKDLDEDSLKLYTLIWARAMACQMEAAQVDQMQLDIGNDTGSIFFQADCTAVDFPGYRSVYEDIETRAIQDSENEPTDHEGLYEILRNLKQRDPLCLENVEIRQHYTEPPPRYSEASLVKEMEELGIGRPSTYATTLRVLQDRKYVTAKNLVLYPEFRGRMVSAFLSHYFKEVSDYSFASVLETELDNVSTGSTEWKRLLKDYWVRFNANCDRASKVHVQQVEKMIERTYANFLFSSLTEESRSCPSCLEGTLIFKVSRYGAGFFIGCDQHPNCKFIAKTLYGEEDEEEISQNDSSLEEPKLLGTHPESGKKVLLKHGPFGSYVQLGEDRKGYLPKRSSIFQVKGVESITLEYAIDLLRYPIKVGTHPVDGLPIVIKISKAGFTVRHRCDIAPVPKSLSPNDIDMNKALQLLSGKKVRRIGRPKGKKCEEEAVDDS
ncbi:unnamed protein product [Amaranthus hypochondriacus]